MIKKINSTPQDGAGEKNDFILIFAATLLLILSMSVLYKFPFWSRQEILVPQIIGKSILTIDFSNGQKRAFEGEIIKNETPIGVLIQASKAGNFYYKLDGKNNLAAIENFTSDDNKSWHWYINDKKIDKSIYEIILKDGDNILIRYE